MLITILTRQQKEGKMTDKQIIIDDVDVSKCNYFNNTDKSYCEECCSEFGCAICNDRPNCYYKQLKCKEQECEELKQWKKGAENLFKAQIDNTDKITNRYKQALDEIEKIVKYTCSKRCTNDCLGTRKHCGYGQILDIINEVKEQTNEK